MLVGKAGLLGLCDLLYVTLAQGFPEDEMRMAASVMMLLAGLAQERAVLSFRPQTRPCRLEHATVLSAAEGPPVLIYAATNLTNDPLEQFTVMAFIFKADGTLEGAPARARPADAQRARDQVFRDGARRLPDRAWGFNRRRGQSGATVGSDAWWRADLQAAAEARVRTKP